jgi:hypothetical protein
MVLKEDKFSVVWREWTLFTTMADIPTVQARDVGDKKKGAHPIPVVGRRRSRVRFIFFSETSGHSDPSGSPVSPAGLLERGRRGVEECVTFPTGFVDRYKIRRPRALSTYSPARSGGPPPLASRRRRSSEHPIGGAKQ